MHNEILIIYDRLSILNYIMLLKYKLIDKYNIKIIQINKYSNIKLLYFYKKVIFIINNKFDNDEINKIIWIFQFNQNIIIINKKNKIIYDKLSMLLNITCLKNEKDFIEKSLYQKENNFLIRYNHLLEKYIKDILNIMPIEYKKRSIAIELLLKNPNFFDYIKVNNYIKSKLIFYISKVNYEFIIDSIDEKINSIKERLNISKSKNDFKISNNMFSLIISRVLTNFVIMSIIIIFFIICKFIHIIKVNCVLKISIFFYLIFSFKYLINLFLNTKIFYTFNYNVKLNIITCNIKSYIKYIFKIDNSFTINCNKLVVNIFNILDIIYFGFLLFFIINYKINLIYNIIFASIINIYFLIKKLILQLSIKNYEKEIYFIKIKTNKKLR